jgi:hypothetical protein
MRSGCMCRTYPTSTANNETPRQTRHVTAHLWRREVCPHGPRRPHITLNCSCGGEVCSVRNLESTDDGFWMQYQQWTVQILVPLKFENTYSRQSNRDRSPVQQRLSGCGARDQSGVLRGMMNPPEPGRMEGQEVSEVASESGPALAMPPKNSSGATSKAPQRDDVECDTQVCFRVSPRSSCKENPNVPRVSLQRHEYVRFLRAEIRKLDGISHTIIARTTQHHTSDQAT